MGGQDLPIIATAVSVVIAAAVVAAAATAAAAAIPPPRVALAAAAAVATASAAANARGAGGAALAAAKPMGVGYSAPEHKQGCEGRRGLEYHRHALHAARTRTDRHRVVSCVCGASTVRDD